MRRKSPTQNFPAENRFTSVTSVHWRRSVGVWIDWCDSETFEVQQRWQQVKVGPSAAGIFVVPDLCKTSDCYEGKSNIRPKGHELQNLAYNTKSDSV